MGSEINIGGRGLPGARAKTWRFYAGYLKKSGDVSMSKVAYGEATANLKSGSIGIKVRILPPNTILPDRLKLKDLDKMTVKVEEVKIETVEKEEVKEDKKVVKKKTVKKKVAKKEGKNENKE